MMVRSQEVNLCAARRDYNAGGYEFGGTLVRQPFCCADPRERSEMV
jgi:hypothetical protein